MIKPAQQIVSYLRIIAGKFRSRQVIFYAEDDLRPTHNRIRETVFNWLAPVIENSVCLDAFAGSGALGFEALSRGAKHVTFCDTSKTVIRTLKDNAEKLKIKNADFLNIDFMQENTLQHKKFDIIFFDPPFQKNLLIKAYELLITRDLLNSNAIIYFECAKNSVDFLQLPKNFFIKKHRKTQTIEYGLWGAI